MELFNNLQGKKTLLIDDDEWIRDSLTLLFESESCSLVALETAEDGIKALTKQSYDIIVVDYRLPGMNGLEFLEWVQDSNPDAVKILITAYGNKDVISRAQKIGVRDFIEKPFTSETIQNSLSHLIKEHKK